jgi:hypothetical protein
MTSFTRRLLPALLVLGTAGAAAAQSLMIFSWKTVSQAEEAMEKEKKPGIFFFEGYDTGKDNVNWCFGQPQIQTQAKKFAVAKIQAEVGGTQGKYMWGQHAKRAEKWGVGTTSTMVFVATDGTVMGTVSSIVKRDELEIFLGKMAAQNTARLKKSEESTHDLDQAEKWIEEKKWGDAVRRVKMVGERSDKIDPKVVDRAKEVEDKLKKACTDETEAVKPLVDDPSKKAEAKAKLEAIVRDFGKFEECKDAKELLKKVQ